MSDTKRTKTKAPKRPNVETPAMRLDRIDKMHYEAGVDGDWLVIVSGHGPDSLALMLSETRDLAVQLNRRES